MIFAKYFEYYTIILRGPFFVDTLVSDIAIFVLKRDVKLQLTFVDAL